MAKCNFTIGMKIVFVAVLVALATFHAQAQNNQNNTEKEYQQKLQKDSINGVYIPKNLKDCFIQLDKILSDKDKQTIKHLENREKTILLHHGFGTWLRNNWGLWGGSRLQQYLAQKGLNHPDDMSAIVLEFYYDWLNGQHDEWKKFEEKKE